MLATRGLNRAVFQFLVASIYIHIGGDIYSNALLCFYTAISIHQAPIGFTCIMLYTGILTILYWLAWLIFLKYVFKGELKVLEEVGLIVLKWFQIVFTI